MLQMEKVNPDKDANQLLPSFEVISKVENFDAPYMEKMSQKRIQIYQKFGNYMVRSSFTCRGDEQLELVWYVPDSWVENWKGFGHLRLFYFDLIDQYLSWYFSEFIWRGDSLEGIPAPDPARPLNAAMEKIIVMMIVMEIL